MLPDSDHILLLIHALGGSDIPDLLLRSTGQPQRRWNDDGYIHVEAPESGLDPELVRLLSDDNRRDQAIAQPGIIQRCLKDDTVTWSLSSELSHALSNSASRETVAKWKALALRLICFACPPTYEDTLTWYGPSIR